MTFLVREGDAAPQLHAGRKRCCGARGRGAGTRRARTSWTRRGPVARPSARTGSPSRPAIEYGSARNVWLFVNGRAIRDRSLTHAVLRAYGELMPHGRYPGALVFLEVVPSEVDVNVHPAKAEVRFADAKAAWESIHAGLTQVLARGEWMQQTRGSGAVEPARVYALGDPAQRVADAIERYGARMPNTWWMPPRTRRRRRSRRSASWWRGPRGFAACATSVSSTARIWYAKARRGWC